MPCDRSLGLVIAAECYANAGLADMLAQALKARISEANLANILHVEKASF